MHSAAHSGPDHLHADHAVRRTRVLLFAAGVSALWAGACFYLVARSQPPVLLAPLGVQHVHVGNTWFSGALPSLLHAFAFTALGAACARVPQRAVWSHALGWACANALWELCGAPIVHAFTTVAHPALTNTGDLLDLLFAALGAALVPCLSIHSTNHQLP